jgi:DNA-binding transcriptional MerR regulator
MTYTVADVINATGLKRRTVQFWADKGVIQATRATQEGGSGVHRLFTRNEVIIACLMHPFSLGWHGDQTRSLSELRELAKTLRHLLRSVAEDFEAAINGQGSFYLVFFWRFGQTPGSGHPTSIETWMEDVQKAKLIFPGIFGTLEDWSGRAEVLYVNEWLQPLRNM